MKTDLRKVAVVVVERALEEGSVLLRHSLSKDGDRLKNRMKQNSRETFTRISLSSLSLGIAV